MSTSSPNASQIFSLDNSFFTSYVQDIEAEAVTTEVRNDDDQAKSEPEDMFGGGGSSDNSCCENTVAPSLGPRGGEEREELKEREKCEDVESQALSSLPLSVLDIKASISYY